MEPGRSIAVAVFATALLAAAADGRAHPPSFADARLLPVPFTLPKMQLPFVLGKSGRRPAADVATTAAPPVPAAPAATPLAPAAPSAAQPAPAAPKAAQPAPAAPSAARAPPRENGPRNKPGDDGDAGIHGVRATTTVRPKPESSTHDRSIITALRKTCPEGQRMSPDRVCRTGFEGAEDDDDAE